MRTRFYHLFPSITAALFIFLFLYTSINKLSGHQTFESVLRHSPLLQNISPLLSWLIPLAEIVIALLLIVPAYRQAGLFFSLILMSVFTLYIGYMIIFTPRLPCSCGGVLQQLSWREHLVFNIVFTALAVTGYTIEKKNKLVIAINRAS